MVLFDGLQERNSSDPYVNILSNLETYYKLQQHTSTIRTLVVLSLGSIIFAVEAEPVKTGPRGPTTQEISTVPLVVFVG